MKICLSEISRLYPIVKRRVANTLISWLQKLLLSEQYKKDVFKKRRTRRVLMCHLPEAFTGKELPKYHSNFTECYTIAKCFDRLGYSVDCVSRTKTDIDYSQYDIVFGINGNAFMGAFSTDQKVRPLKIFYSVGGETFFNYRETALRNKDFHDRHGLWLLSSNRYVPGDVRTYYEANLSDAVICLGDEYVFSHFVAEDKQNDKYRWLPAFFFPTIKPTVKKDFVQCRKEILWFGSSGMVHKGLDIAIDFAIKHPEYRLHICGGSRQESDFWNYYMPKIRANKNIYLHGFVDIESEKYAQILSQCGILLNPTISEGGAVSVLNVLGNGVLLPVYSEATGIALSDVGVCVPNVAYKDFEEALLALEAMPVDVFEQKALRAHLLVKDNYTIEKYEEHMFAYLKEIIEKNR
ncbi:MAG: glycosyltransferase [Bacteroidaceae bacterium]|nr:glycosyltransferase [Bacteroidaceae bacterium]